MEEWSDLLSQMKELANKNASVPPALASILNNINLFSSVIDPSLYTSCCTVSAEDDSGPGFGCNNPYGDGSDPTYVCSKYCDGKCKSQCGEDTKCKERYSLEELD